MTELWRSGRIGPWSFGGVLAAAAVTYRVGAGRHACYGQLCSLGVHLKAERSLD